jgi:hypothetical protein
LLAVVFEMDDEQREETGAALPRRKAEKITESGLEKSSIIVNMFVTGFDLFSTSCSS